MSSLIDALVRKSRRALRSAQLDLRDGDTDGAVNRSYYAMVNAAQAALLSSGIPEDKLPNERRRRAAQEWLEYRKKQKQAAQSASRERENNRARDQSGSSDRGRDFDDDSG